MPFKQHPATQHKQGILSFWNNYWFHPAPLFNLAVCRILIVGFQLSYLFIEGYLSNVLSQVGTPGLVFSPLPVFELLNAPFAWDAPPAFFLAATFLATVSAGALALIGLKTNLSLLVFAVGNLYLQTYLFSFGSFHHPEALMLISLFVLALSPAGKALSVDNLSWHIKKHSQLGSFQAFSVLQASSELARWPLLLIQWLMAIAYFSAALNKLSIDGAGLFSADWMNGYTLQYYLLSDGLTWDSDLGVWLGHQHLLAVVSSWIAILFESTLFLTLFCPRLVWLYIPTGALFHIGIYFAQGAPFFQYIDLYVVFLPWAAIVKAIAHRLKSTAGPQPEIYYSGLYPPIIRLTTVLCYFDWFNQLAYRDIENDRSHLDGQHDRSLKAGQAGVYLIQPNSSVQQGFFALRNALKYLPPLWLLLALMHLPGANKVGPKVYSFIAFRRQRTSL